MIKKYIWEKNDIQYGILIKFPGGALRRIVLHVPSYPRKIGDERYALMNSSSFILTDENMSNTELVDYLNKISAEPMAFIVYTLMYAFTLIGTKNNKFEIAALLSFMLWSFFCAVWLAHYLWG